MKKIPMIAYTHHLSDPRVRREAEALAERGDQVDFIQAIITFVKLREIDNDAINQAKKVAQWATENMRDDKRGYFYFQKTKYFTNKIPYLRWPNVWMYYALSLLVAEIR